MRHALIAAVCCLALSGCADMGSLLSGVAVSATSATPTQAKTVAEATQAATAAEHALDFYVVHGNPSPAVLQELKILVPAVHNALVKVEDANRAGNSVLAAAAMSAFNEALAAYKSYSAFQGVPQ